MDYVCGDVALWPWVTNCPGVENGPRDQYRRQNVGQSSNLPHFLSFPPSVACLEKIRFLHNATPHTLIWGLGEEEEEV